MVSIIVPVYAEPYLNRTIDSLIQNARGEIEILVILDGDNPKEPVRSDPKVKVISLSRNHGMRGALNAGITAAMGDFIMKLDAHCIVSEGYDVVLSQDCAENWLMVPRRYSLDEAVWKRNEKMPIRDYCYLRFPGTSNNTFGFAMQVSNWDRRGREVFIIDDTMTFQGSGWFANRKYFKEHVGLYDDRSETYGTFAQDQQEVGLKYWLGGGEIKVNKKIWYAHLQKRGQHYKSGNFSHLHKKDALRIHGDEWGTKHWMNNEEPNMIHPFSWLVEKFWPLPDWPEDWREQWAKHS